MKMKLTVIHISETTRTKLLKYCGTHKVSFSTVVEALTYANLEIQKQLITDYLVNRKEGRTSLKVRESAWDMKLNDLEKSKLYTNLLYLYFNKKLKNYYETKRFQRINEIFQHEIDKKTDEYWNYNNHIRNEARMLKNRNMREYLKRKLKQYEM